MFALFIKETVTNPLDIRQRWKSLCCKSLILSLTNLAQVSFFLLAQRAPAETLDTWFLVGLAARLAVGMGLHAASSYESLPTDVAERRKRLFFSVYMMDRYV